MRREDGRPEFANLQHQEAHYTGKCLGKMQRSGRRGQRREPPVQLARMVSWAGALDPKWSVSTGCDRLQRFTMARVRYRRLRQEP